MGANTDDKKDGDLTALIIYRLDQAEKKLQNLDDKVNNLSGGFIGLKAELEFVAKNEGKTSGAISGVVTGIIVGLIAAVLQFVMKTQ